jgi:hypothetical protein
VRLALAVVLHKPYSLALAGGRGILFRGIQMPLKAKNFTSLFVNDDFMIVKLSN